MKDNIKKIQTLNWLVPVTTCEPFENNGVYNSSQTQPRVAVFFFDVFGSYRIFQPSSVTTIASYNNRQLRQSPVTTIASYDNRQLQQSPVTAIASYNNR